MRLVRTCPSRSRGCSEFRRPVRAGHLYRDGDDRRTAPPRGVPRQRPEGLQDFGFCWRRQEWRMTKVGRCRD